MRPKQSLTLSLESSLSLIASIVTHLLLVGAEIVCPHLCTCRLSAHAEVIECNGKNLTSMPYLSDSDTTHTKPIFDLYINRNRFGYILRHSLYSFAERLRILEIMDNEENIEIANAAFEPFRESLKVLRIGPLSGNLSDQLILFSPLTCLVELTISSCSDDGGGVLSEPFFSEDSDPHLEVLDIQLCRLWHIENITFRQLKLKNLNLSNNKFTEIPPAVTVLIAASLTCLYMANNSIGVLKHSYMPHSCKLSVLNLSFNRLTSIQANTLEKCNHLQILNLSHNQGLVSIGPGVFRGLTNLIIDLDHTGIANLNFIQPDKLLALRLAGSKIPCTCELQKNVRRSFGYKIRGTCVNVDDVTVAGGKDMDISYLELDCYKDTKQESVHREDIEDNKEAQVCTHNPGKSETTDPHTDLKYSSVTHSTLRDCSRPYHQPTSTEASDLFPDASTSNLDPKEASISELAPANAAVSSYIDYFNPTVAVSLLFSIDLTKPQEQAIIYHPIPETLPTHLSNDASSLQQKMAFTPVQSSLPFLTEVEMKEQSLPPTLQFKQIVKELTTQPTPIDSTHLQERAAKSQPNKELLYSRSLPADSETISAPLSASIFQENTLVPLHLLTPSEFVSTLHILSKTERAEYPTKSHQPSQAVSIAGLTQSCVMSGSWSELLSREKTEVPIDLCEDQVTVTPSVTHLEITAASSSRHRLPPVEERNPRSLLPLWSSAEQTSPLLKEETSNSESQVRSDSLPHRTRSSSLLHQVGVNAQPQQTTSTALPQAGSNDLSQVRTTSQSRLVGSTALTQQAESTVLPQQAEPTVLPQQAESTILPQQAESTVLTQQAESTVLPQHIESFTLHSPGEELISALGIHLLEESPTTDKEDRLGHHTGLKSSIIELSGINIEQSTHDVPASVSRTSKLLCSAGDPQQFHLWRKSAEPSWMTPSSDAMPIPRASIPRRGREHPRYNRINRSAKYQRWIWRNVESSTKISFRSTKEHSEGSKLEARLWILRCPICMLACCIHGCLTFAAFLTMEHGASK